MSNGNVEQVIARRTPEAARSTDELYIGDLPSDIERFTLTAILELNGKLASLDLKNGYAYAKYHDPDHARGALEDLDGTLIEGKQCRVTWSQRDPTLRMSGEGNLFVKNFDKKVKNAELCFVFEKFGGILSSRFVRDDGNSPFGYVHYDNIKSAEDAVKAANSEEGISLNGTRLIVERFVPLEKRFTNVYFKNLDLGLTKEEVEKIFSKYGEVTHVTLPTDADGKSRGFGYVKFMKNLDARRAIDSLDGMKINGKKLFVDRAKHQKELEAEFRKSKHRTWKERKTKRDRQSAVHVENLDRRIHTGALRADFRRFGNIIDAEVRPAGKNGASGLAHHPVPWEAKSAFNRMRYNPRGYMGDLGSRSTYEALVKGHAHGENQSKLQHEKRLY